MYPYKNYVGRFFSSIDYILKKSIIDSKFSSFWKSKWDEY